jgi:hypothetical protein
MAVVVVGAQRKLKITWEEINLITYPLPFSSPSLLLSKEVYIGSR